MSLRAFIRANRAAIDAHVYALRTRPNDKGERCDGIPSQLDNDEERRQWVLNDEPLYRWARAEGCRI